MTGITVSGGGSTAVATDDLLTAADRLTALSREAMLLGEEVRVIAERFAEPLPGGRSALAARAASDVSHAIIVLGQIEVEARALSWALTSSAEGYAFVENVLGLEVASAFGLGGAAVGRLGPVAGVLTTAGLATGASLLGGDDGLRGFLTTPAGVALARELVMASDDAVLGAAGAPPWLAAALGDSGLGVVGLATVAGLAGRAGMASGVLRETPVRIVGATALPTDRPPVGMAERLAAIPDPGRAPGALAGDQVRVDVWERPDGTRVAEAYIAGTVTFEPSARGEPFDMAGNLAAVAGDAGASTRAVEAALDAAGVTPQTPVQVVGYSQGGAVAAQIAASDRWDVRGLVTFGGPTGQIPIPPDIPAVLVENTDDPVTALGGRQDNAAATVLSRQAFPDGATLPDTPLPPHERPAYVQTAAEIDAASSHRVRDAVGRIDAFTAGCRLVSSTSFEIDRVEAPVSASGFPTR